MGSGSLRGQSLHLHLFIFAPAHQSRRKTWCGRRELNPHGPFKPCGFSCRLRLSPPGCRNASASRLRSGLSLHPPPEEPELRCCPSSLYTFPVRASSGLGSGLPFEVSPNLSSSASPVSRRALKFSLSPLRMPFRHARARLSDCLSMIRPGPLLSPVRLPVSPPGHRSKQTDNELLSYDIDLLLIIAFCRGA